MTIVKEVSDVASRPCTRRVVQRQGQQIRREDAGQEPSAAQMGLWRQGSEVGEEASLQQQGQASEEKEEGKVKDVQADRSGRIPPERGQRSQRGKPRQRDEADEREPSRIPDHTGVQPGHPGGENVRHGTKPETPGSGEENLGETGVGQKFPLSPSNGPTVDVHGTEIDITP